MKVSQHAAERYCERMQVTDRLAAAKSIEELLKEAEDVELKPKFRTAALMDHGKEAKYKRCKRIVFVVCDDTVVTVHDGAADRWRKVSR